MKIKFEFQKMNPPNIIQMDTEAHQMNHLTKWFEYENWGLQTVWLQCYYFKLWHAELVELQPMSGHILLVIEQEIDIIRLGENTG